MSQWRTRQRDRAARRARTAGRQPVSVPAGAAAPVRMAGALPVWRWRCAPEHLITRRQMREAGLAPGGAEPVGLIECRAGRRWAHLWDRHELTPKRVPTPAQLGALNKAMAARRWCTSCEQDVGYCVPTSLGRCVDCAYPDSTDTAAASRDGPGPLGGDGHETTSPTSRRGCRATATYQTGKTTEMTSNDSTNYDWTSRGRDYCLRQYTAFTGHDTALDRSRYQVLVHADGRYAVRPLGAREWWTASAADPHAGPSTMIDESLAEEPVWQELLDGGQTSTWTGRDTAAERAAEDELTMLHPAPGGGGQPQAVTVKAYGDWATQQWEVAENTVYRGADNHTDPPDTDPLDPIVFQENLVPIYAEQARNHPDAEARHRFAQLGEQANARAQALRATQPGAEMLAAFHRRVERGVTEDVARERVVRAASLPGRGDPLAKAASLTAGQLAEETIGLFLEYRDSHGYDPQRAAAAALRDVAEGLATRDWLADRSEAEAAQNQTAVGVDETDSTDPTRPVPARPSAPSVREIAALTARLRALSDAGAGADPVERAEFLADKNALIERITAAMPDHDQPDTNGEAAETVIEQQGPSALAEELTHWAPTDVPRWLNDFAEDPEVTDAQYFNARTAAHSAILGERVDQDHQAAGPELGSPGFLNRARADLAGQDAGDQLDAARADHDPRSGCDQFGDEQPAEPDDRPLIEGRPDPSRRFKFTTPTTGIGPMTQVDNDGVTDAVVRAGEAVHQLHHQHRPDLSGIRHWQAEQARLVALGESDEWSPGMTW